ncbi:MAG: inositol monophosphatase family protein, partial [Solirubrobacteraceae bacterium]
GLVVLGVDGSLAVAVHHPMRRDTFTAVRGESARLGDRVLRGSDKSDLATAMVATGFAYDARLRALQGHVVAGLIGRVRDLRRFGAAALDLAWTATGRFDAYYERGLNEWDLAAGELICLSAGLVRRELPARGELPRGIMVCSAGLADDLEALVG